jgi:hypothetical protein
MSFGHNRLTSDEARKIAKAKPDSFECVYN